MSGPEQGGGVGSGRAESQGGVLLWVGRGTEAGHKMAPAMRPRAGASGARFVSGS